MSKKILYVQMIEKILLLIAKLVNKIYVQAVKVIIIVTII